MKGNISIFLFFLFIIAFFTASHVPYASPGAFFSKQSHTHSVTSFGMWHSGAEFLDIRCPAISNAHHLHPKAADLSRIEIKARNNFQGTCILCIRTGHPDVKKYLSHIHPFHDFW